jgi:hypothetical protein
VLHGYLRLTGALQQVVSSERVGTASPRRQRDDPAAIKRSGKVGAGLVPEGVSVGQRRY